MAHPNPCPNPGIPPLRIELSDIPVAKTDDWYPFALKVLKGYWRQATNMTTDDQWEYKSLIEGKAFMADYCDPLIHHDLFTDFLISPTWAKYVFLQSLFGDDSMFAIDRFLEEKFNDPTFDNLEEEYRTHHQEPSLPDGEVSGKTWSQSITSSYAPHPDWRWTVAPTRCDLKNLETHLRAYIVKMESRILEEVRELRTHVMASASSNDQMPAMLDEQTNSKKRKQNTVV